MTNEREHPQTPELTETGALEAILDMAPGVTAQCDAILDAAKELAANANDPYDPDSDRFDLAETTDSLADGITAAHALRETITDAPLDIDEVDTANTAIVQVCGGIRERQ